MSEAGNAAKKPPESETNPPTGANRVTELKVSGHLMTLDTGMFCVFQGRDPRPPATGPVCPGCGSRCRRAR
jgi:hypothetical protein